jgi:Tfp pilus assembly protein PilF
MPVLDLEAEGSLSTCRKHTFAILALSFLILIIYSNTFRASWHLDDEQNILANPQLHLTKLSWKGIREAISSPPTALRKDIKFLRPISRLSLALNYYLGGKDVFGYHVTNLGIHMITTIFLYLFMFHTLRLPSLRAKYGPNAYSLALLAAVFWSIHPIQTQAVTYVVQRMACLSGMFYIMAMYLFLRGRETQQRRLKFVHFALSVLCGLLSFGSKENAILLPLSIALYDLLLIRGVSKANVALFLRLFLLFFVGPLIAGIILLRWAGVDIFAFLSLYDMRPFGVWERLMTEGRVVLFYLSLLFYPVSRRFSADHPMVPSESLLVPPSTLLSMFLLTAVVAGAVAVAKRHPLVAFATLFFFLNHLVESTILPLELIFEHRNYIPSMFIFLPIAIGLLGSISYFSSKRRIQLLISAFTTLLIIGVGHASYMRNFAWLNEKSLWLSCLQIYPDSYRARHNLGRAYHRRGEYGKAFSHYHKALRCKSLHSRKEKGMTYFNLGLLASEANDYDKAQFCYLKALQLDPCCPGAHNNLAGILNEAGESVEKIYQQLLVAVECDQPAEVPLALSNLGILLMKKGQAEEAVASLEKALTLDPHNEMTLLRLGYVHKVEGRLGTASIYFLKALELDKRNVEALLYMAELHVLAGNTVRASEYATRVVDVLRPEGFAAFVDEMGRNDNLLRISPDLDSLFGFLHEAYDRKALLLKENAGHARDLDQRTRARP